MRVEFTNGTFYNGQDLKGYLLDFSLADIGFGGVYPANIWIKILYFISFKSSMH